MKHDRRGISPIVAVIFLIAATAVGAAALARYFGEMRPPTRVRRTDVQVFAGLINENIVRLHIQHIGGETVTRPLDPEYAIRGKARAIGVPGIENDIYCWTFEDPERFRQGDWARAEVQLRGAGLRIGSSIWVNIWRTPGGDIYTGEVVIDDITKIPG